MTCERCGETINPLDSAIVIIRLYRNYDLKERTITFCGQCARKDKFIGGDNDFTVSKS